MWGKTVEVDEVRHIIYEERSYWYWVACGERAWLDECEVVEATATCIACLGATWI